MTNYCTSESFYSWFIFVMQDIVENFRFTLDKQKISVINKHLVFLYSVSWVQKMYVAGRFNSLTARNSWNMSIYLM